MFGFIKEMFIRLLRFAGLQVNVCDTTKCVSLDNQPCQVWPTLVDTNSNEPLYNPLNVSVNKFGGSWNTIADPCPQRCVTNKV